MTPPRFASTLTRCTPLLAGVVMLASAMPALAQAPFYQDKKVTMVIGSSAGGGYDLYARIVSRHLSKHIPGNPAVIVSNMGGAGSHVAAAYIANSAPKGRHPHRGALHGRRHRAAVHGQEAGDPQPAGVQLHRQRQHRVQHLRGAQRMRP